MNFETLLILVKLGRLRFPIIGFLLYSFGFLLGKISGFDVSWTRYAVGFIISFAANLSVSYSNDYFDMNLDRYGKPTSVSGGSGILLRHPELMELSKKIAKILLAISILASIVSTLYFALPPFFPAIVVFANFLGWYYAAPPVKLAYRGLSELTVVIAVGVLMPVTGYLMAKNTLDVVFLSFLLPSIFYSLAFIISVEIPDLESDRLGGKNTLIVRKGRRFGFLLVAVLFTLSTVFFLALSVTSSALTIMPKIDFRLITIISLIPLSLIVQDFYLKNQGNTLKSVEHILLGFSVLLLLLDCYLIML